MTQKLTSGFSLEAANRDDANHLFVSNVRFWSMFAIIAVHSLTAWGVHNDSPIGSELQIVLMQGAKFGTIGFYLISGFLLGERLHRHPAPEYFLRRLKRVGVPWLVWASLFVLLPFAKVALVGRATHGNSASIWKAALDVLVLSPYWFVPNFLFALMLLLLFKHRLDDLRLGAALASMSLFYSVNLYTRWVPANHTSAVFGFVFYLWLGNWVARNRELVSAFLERITAKALLIAILGLGTLALGEAHLLSRLGDTNPVNTLRISNQLFSVMVVLALTKLRDATWPRFIDVRLNTFGLYLVHPMCIFLLCHAFDLVYRFVTNAKAGSLLQNSAQFWAYPALAVGMWATMFVLCYSMSLVLVQALVARSALSWIVGQPAPSEAPVRGANLRLRLAPRLTLPAIHADVQAERS